MSSRQSVSSRLRDPAERARTVQKVQDYGRRNRHPLLAGTVLGLAIGILAGLVIGWVVWPVEWTGTTLSHLAPEDKANYIATVAEAYVSERSGEAAELARQRLAPFGTAMNAEVTAARDYFLQNVPSDGSPHVANLNELSSALGLSAPAPEVVQAPTEADDTEGRVIPTGVNESSGWFLTLLWLTTAFVLIASGVWVLRTVFRPQPADTRAPHGNHDEIDEFDPEDEALDEETHAGEDPFATIPVLAAQDMDKPAATRSPVSDLPAAGDQVSPAVLAERQNVTVTSGSAGALFDTVLEDEADGYGFEPEQEMEPEADSVSTTIISDIGDEVGAKDHPTQVNEASVISVEEEGATTAVLSAGNEVSAPPIATFIAHFQRGFEEHDEAFRIEDVHGYAGDCGLGVNMKQGLVGQNPENVAVLDVWLVDAPENRGVSFHSRSLLSPYGVANGLASELSKSADGDEVLPHPKPGDKFQIIGATLLLNCEVLDVRYVRPGPPEGIFSELQLSMTASRRLNTL